MYIHLCISNSSSYFELKLYGNMRLGHLLIVIKEDKTSLYLSPTSFYYTDISHRIPCCIFLSALWLVVGLPLPMLLLGLDFRLGGVNVKVNTVVPLLKDTLGRTSSRGDTNSWHQVLWMHVMLPLTKGQLCNKDRIVWQKWWLIRGGPLCWT